MLLMPVNAYAVTANFPTSAAEQATAMLCLNEEEQDNLAAFKLNCDAQELDLIKCKSTLDACINQGAPPSYWWAEPAIVVGGLVISAGIGALVVALVKG